MFDLGIATSVAKDLNYSWELTTEIAKSLGLRNIQYYLPQNCIIPILNINDYFDNIYLHLPNDFHLQEKRYLLAAKKFDDTYSSQKIVVHQNERLPNEEYFEVISKFVREGFKIGIENEAGNNLYSYIELIRSQIQNKQNIFPVIDFHRFFKNFYMQFNSELILDMVFRLLNLCASNEIKIVLHIIDSNSFSGDRKFWTPMLNGVLPYKEIFSYILKKQVSIESIILEYESKELIKESIPILRKSVLFFGRN